MKIKKTILILTSEHKKNKGIDDLKEYLNKYFDDFDVFIIDENQTGGKGAAKRRSDINRFFIQNYGGELSPRAFIEEKIRSFRAEAGIKHSAKSQERVKNAMLRFNPESVLATTPEMLYYAVEAKKREDLSCKVIGLVNSFTFDKRYFNAAADGYIVANMQVKNQITGMGYPSADVKVLGLPMKYASYSTEQVVAAKKELGLADKPTVYLCGGIYGNGNIANIYKLLTDQGEYINLIVDCGQNGRLYNKFLKDAENRKLQNVKIYHNTEETDSLLTASDIVITTYCVDFINNCLLRTLPVIAVSPMDEREEREFSYLEENDLVLYARDTNQVITYMYKIIQDGIGVRLIDGAKLNMNTNSLFDVSNYLTLTVNAD